MSALERMRVLSAHLRLVSGPAPPSRALREITPAELAEHKTAKSMWLAIDGIVYDMTPFLDDHPGGKRLPLKYGGTDASEVWHSMHRPEILAEHAAPLAIGVLAGSRAAPPTGAPAGARPAARDARAYAASLGACERELRAFIDEENCHPILIRLAWHDSGTYDRALAGRWPECGGANGSIRFDAELAHGANAGLKKAVLYLQPFKDKFIELSWADLIQLGGAIALELAGGPRSPVRYGRVDVESEAGCPPEGRLPSAYPPFPGNVDAATHLRHVFGRMGFSDAEIVALSGAHTLGRAFRERSGVVSEGYGKASATRFTHPDTNRPRADGAAGLGMAGGRSWTERWLAFDNSYYADGLAAGQRGEAGAAGGGGSGAPPRDGALLWMPTDAALHSDPIFRLSASRYAHDARAFATDFASAHAKLAELGSRFDPPEGIVLP
ncbi:hypothetical protein KFE25_007435 [Diacronema lutheri]|uniref:L-ascorbate peroxidase n=2 Tax=Diacronema lutheri TaxID=2081491 RepID=A0A8J5XV18_DIALT|nr:hypothetical protein KFE25_007435 [Diacronema lutheri]